MIIQNGLVFTEAGKFEELTITTINDKIYSLTPTVSANPDDVSIHHENAEVIDASDCYVIPGLVDIHMHGCMGIDFCDIAHVNTQEEANTLLQNIASYELTHGITAFCPATMTLPIDTLSKICNFTAKYLSSPLYSTTDSHPSISYASFAECPDSCSPLATAGLSGIYLEGPFLSPLRCGAQNKDSLKLPDYSVFQDLMTASKDLIRVVAIAPELDGAIDFIKSVSTYMPQITCSLAHTDADYNTACHAFEAGATQVTHLFNAMAPLHHRKPGVIGAAFDTSDCYVECISDGIHLAPSIIRACFQLFGAYCTTNYHGVCDPSDDFLWSSSANRIILISDSTMATGMPDGHYHLGNQDITVQDKLATLTDGTIAGSCSNLMECMQAAVSFGIPLEHAITASTINPARAIGIDTLHGSICAGKYANLLLLDKETLVLRKIIYHGVEVN